MDDVQAFAVVMTIIVCSIASFAVIGLGSWTWYRRVTRRSEPALPPAVDEQRLERLEQAVEAIAIEVERISEGQRFTVNLLRERLPDRALPGGTP